MAIALVKLQQYFSGEKLIHHSIDLSLYQLSALVEDEEHYITHENGNFLRAVNLIELQNLLQNLPTKTSLLRHTSAYDEMIDGPVKISSTLLEIPLADNQLN